MKKILLLMAAALLFSGCTTKNDLAMMALYIEGEKEISKNYATAAMAKAEAIRATIGEDSGDLQRYLAAKEIEAVEIQPSKLERPKSIGEAGAELASNGVELTKMAITGVGVYKGLSVLEKALSNGGDTNNITTTGDNSGIAYEKSVDNSKRIVTNAGEGTINYDEAGGKGAAQGDEFSGECTPEALSVFFDGCTEGKPLGDAMTCVSAESGCLIDLQEGEVLINYETPWPEMTSKYAGQIAEEEGKPVGTEV